MAQLISSYNVAHQLQNYVCEALSASEWLQQLSVEFFPENAKDIDFQIKNALRRQGLACIVMTPNLQYQGHNGTDIAWDARDLTLQIAEFTPVNRASNKLSVVTGLDLAVFAQNYLGGPQCAEQFGKFCPKAIQQSEEGGLLITKATFDTTVLGSIPGPYEWDGHHVITVPWAFLSDLQELSDYVHNMPDVGELSAQVAVISGDLSSLSVSIADNYLGLGGGWLRDGAGIGMTDQAWATETEINGHFIRIEDTVMRNRFSASPGGVNFYAGADEEGDPAGLLSAITFTINSETKTLADILSGYVSRQYVDDMIGDLEHLLETT